MLGAGTDARITGPATFKIVRDTADPVTHRSRYRLVLFDGELIHIKHQQNAAEHLIIDTPLVAVEPPHDTDSDIAISVPKTAPTQISNNSTKPVRITSHADPHTSISVPAAHTAHTPAPTQETIHTLEQRDTTPPTAQSHRTHTAQPIPTPPSQKNNPPQTQPQHIAQIAIAPSTQTDAIARALRDEATTIRTTPPTTQTTDETDNSDTTNTGHTDTATT